MTAPKIAEFDERVETPDQQAEHSIRRTPVMLTIVRKTAHIGPEDGKVGKANRLVRWLRPTGMREW